MTAISLNDDFRLTFITQR